MLTQEQRAQRIGKVTSSVAPAALGLHPYMSPLQAWLQIMGRANDIGNTKAIDRGNRLEEMVLDFAAEETGLQRYDAPFIQLHPWTGDSADALYCDSWGDVVALGEAKTAALGIAKWYGEEGTDNVHPATLIQSHWHLAHRPQVPECLVPVLVGGYMFEFRLYRIQRDAEFTGCMLQELEKWHRDHVIADRMPDVNHLDTEWVKNRFPSHVPAHVLADTVEIDSLAHDVDLHRKARQEAEKAEESAKNRLRMILGDAEAVKASWGSISFKRSADRAAVNWEAMARSLGATDEHVQRYTHSVPGSRTLRVTVRE